VEVFPEGGETRRELALELPHERSMMLCGIARRLSGLRGGLPAKTRDFFRSQCFIFCPKSVKIVPLLHPKTLKMTTSQGFDCIGMTARTRSSFWNMFRPLVCVFQALLFEKHTQRSAF